MNFTLWTVALVGLGAILFFGRRRWERKRLTAESDRSRSKLAAEQAEIDRQACLDLGRSLMSNMPSSRPEPGKSSTGNSSA